ncbi:unnamed protein product, partial [Didymodactylos carnosus]
EKPHACTICGKAFSTSSSLNTHSRIHSGEKPHSCEVCGKRFTASSNLYYHRMTHTKKKPHKCGFCEKSFATPGDLRGHIHIHRGTWPYLCPQCSKGFSKQTNLKNHLLTHTVLWMIAGLIMIITGGITAVSSFRTGISPLVIVGVAMWAGGILIIGFGCMAIQSRRMQRLREAVANESVKYSSASRPASWRIDTFQWYGWQRRNVTYNLVIDLEPNFAMAQNVYPTPSYSTAPPAYQQNKRPESSPHDNNQVQPVTYCSKCGAARQDYAGNFCSSCGQSYHKY